MALGRFAFVLLASLPLLAAAQEKPLDNLVPRKGDLPTDLNEPQSAEEAYRRASHLMQTAHVDEGILMFGKAIVLKPDWAQALAARGRALSQAKRYAEAIKDFDEAIRVDDKHAVWYDARGLAYSNSDQHKRAIEDYNRAIELSPTTSVYYNNRGWAYSESGQPEKGVEDLTKAIQLAPDYVKAYENRAVAYARMKDWTHAIADYTAAIEVRPTAWQYQKRAEAKLASGDQKGAEEDRLKVVQTVSERTPEPLGAKSQGQTQIPQSAYSVGDGVSAPVPLFKPDPEYSEVARKARLRGTVTLQLIVDSLGGTRDIRVLRSLGLGLDEKAVDAVRSWRFRPGYRNGEAVAVKATVQVKFNFLEPPHGWQVTRVGFNVPPGAMIPELIDLLMPKSHSYKNSNNAQPILMFEVDQSGTPQHLQVIGAADSAMIEDLIKAAQAWHFAPAPAQQDGTFISASASFEFSWIGTDKK
jgi:TonB family protein